MNENQFIFNQKRQADPESLVEYFTISGSEDFFDDDQMPRQNSESEKTYAKKTIRPDGSVKYSIRLSLSNKLYDPTSKYGLDKTKSFLDNTVRNENRFKNVSYKTFELYLSFLKTKNVSWLLNAERESE